MYELTEEKKARFAALREAARAKRTPVQTEKTLEEAFGDDATLTQPQSVESFIAAMGLEGKK
jgi:hypothetical protein